MKQQTGMQATRDDCTSATGNIECDQLATVEVAKNKPNPPQEGLAVTAHAPLQWLIAPSDV